MGWKYEVTRWVNDEHSGWCDQQVYGGKSLIMALWVLWQERRNKTTGCSRLTIRG